MSETKKNILLFTSSAVAMLVVFCVLLIPTLLAGPQHEQPHLVDFKGERNKTGIDMPECSQTRRFRVFFSQIITICLSQQQVFIGIHPYGQEETGILFNLREWNGFLRQLQLIKMVIKEIQHHSPAHPASYARLNKARDIHSPQTTQHAVEVV